MTLQVIMAAMFFAFFVYLLIASLTGNMPKRWSKVREPKQGESRIEKVRAGSTKVVRQLRLRSFGEYRLAQQLSVLHLFLSLRKSSLSQLFLRY